MSRLNWFLTKLHLRKKVVQIPLATPELDKLTTVAETSQKIGEFLDWLQSEKHYIIAEWIKDSESPQPVYCGSHGTIEGLLAEYYEIDLNKVEREKQAILDDFRKRNKIT